MEKELSTVQKLIDQIALFFVNYSFQVVGALLVLVIGMVIANSLAALFLKFLSKKNVDITLSKFLAATVRIIVISFAIIIALGKFGITIAPFVAALSAMALGASFAIRGPLSNYGAGLSIILSRPFRVGNTISVKDVSGVVEEIKLANTRLQTEDGVEITIPNNQIVGEILFNSREYKVVESVIGISYDSEPEKAINVIKEVLSKFSEVTKQPGAQVGIENFGDSSITIAYRYWVPTVKYFYTLYAVNLAVFKAFQQAGISIPFPQREIRMLNQPVASKGLKE